MNEGTQVIHSTLGRGIVVEKVSGNQVSVQWENGGKSTHAVSELKPTLYS